MAAANLPAEIAPFVGRRGELDQARRLIAHDVRLLTLTGPGGVGKTRLALQVARHLEQSMFDGAWMIDLSELPQADDAERLYAHLAYGLGIRHHGQAGLDVLLDHVSTRRVLLVLDSCEHVLPATRDCVTALLHAAPQLRVLVTSRQALHAEYEHTLVVPPLPLRDSIALFNARAAAAGANPDAMADKEIVAELCRRLDGLPLAIRLAAGRVRSLSLKQLLDHLDDPFRLLTEAPLVADGPHRHSTMERVVAWSYELCTEDEQRLWMRAAVFARAFDLPALEAVCGGDGINRSEVLDLVSGLVDKSVFAVDDATHPTRYYMLDTLRDYGLRNLDAAGETQRVRGRHRDYHRKLVADAATTWLGPAELDAMALVYRHLPDILAAVDESLVRNDLAIARAICRDLVRVRAPFFWGFLDLARQQLHRVVDASDPERLNSADEAADVSSTMAAAAWVATTQGLHQMANSLLDAAADVHRRWEIAPTPPVLFATGGSEAFGAGSVQAIELLAAARASLTAPEARGDRHMATMVWAMATAFAGEPAAAIAASGEYLGQAEDAQAPWAISWARWTAALAALRSGDHKDAADHISQALGLQRDMDDHWGQTWSIELCAWIIAARLQRADNPRGEAERAAWLMGAARARRQALGVSLAGIRPLTNENARAYAQITGIVGELTIAAAIEAGSRGHAQAVRIALGEPTARRPSASGVARLTDREREVAALLVKGRTSRQIGAELRIEPATVDKHVKNIAGKLGVSSRIQIAAWAATHLTPS